MSDFISFELVGRCSHTWWWFNRDPLNTRTDAEILDALKRAWLLPKEGPVDPVTEAKFSLDSQVSDEGTGLHLMTISLVLTSYMQAPTTALARSNCWHCAVP